jgi:cell division control protein 6
MRSFDKTDDFYDDIDALEPDAETYRPKELPERKEELGKFHSALEPIARGGTPRDVLIYGPTGQGKTHAVTLKTEQLQEWADKNDVALTTVHIQCKGSDN